MRHISQKDMIRLLSDDSAKRIDLRSHLDQCPLCAEKFNKIKRILSPENNIALAPSEKLLNRILTTYRNRATKTLQLPIWRIFTKKQLIGSVAAVFIVALTIVLHFTFGTSHREELFPAYDIVGARISDKKETTFTLSAGDIITTKKYEHVRISLDNRIDIVLYGESILGVEHSKKDEASRKRNITCNLSYGKIHVKIIDKTGIHLAFKTPHGTITAAGTEFRIHVLSNQTLVFLKEGTLAIENNSGEKIALSAGMKCNIAAAITTSPLLPGEFEEKNIPSGIQKNTTIPPSAKHASGDDATSISKTESENETKSTAAAEKNSLRNEYRDEAKKESRAAAKESRRSFRHGNK